jgi:hypothetical protein
MSSWPSSWTVGRRQLLHPKMISNAGPGLNRGGFCPMHRDQLQAVGIKVIGSRHGTAA